MAGPGKPGRPCKVLPAEYLARYRSGETALGLALELGWNKSTVRKALRRAGAGPRPVSRRVATAAEVAAYLEGVPAVALARRAGISPTTMCYALRLAGVTVRRPGWKGRGRKETA